MGPTLNNLDRLLRLPFGCGEQNMIHFAPNVFVLRYLQKTRQLSPEVETEATDYLLQGTHNHANIHSNTYTHREKKSVHAKYCLQLDLMLHHHFSEVYTPFSKDCSKLSST